MVLGIFGGVKMKFKNIFFGFLRTWLLVAIFYSGLLCAAGDMILILEGHPYVVSNPSPYFFRKDPNTGNLIKVYDAKNDFQFETYVLESEDDFESYDVEIKPVLLDWEEEEYSIEPEVKSAGRLSKKMIGDIEREFGNGIPKEIHVATYKGDIEALAYSDSAEMEVPEIDIIVANPNGMVTGQMTIPKGGGSSLMDYMIQRYRIRGVERIKLYSINDEYYLSRGWKRVPESGACGGGE